jgi:hypothetical protein
MSSDKRRKKSNRNVQVYRSVVVQEYSVKTQPNGYVHTFFGPVKKQVECFKKYDTQHMLRLPSTITPNETPGDKEMSSDFAKNKFGLA